MGLDIPDRPPKCPAPGMAVIRMIDFVLVIYQTKVPVLQLHIPNVPNVLCVVTDQRHVVGIRNNDSEVISVDCPQFFRGKHAYHLTSGSATI